MTINAERCTELLEGAGIRVPRIRTILNADPLLVGFPVHAREAIEVWESVRAVTDRTGLYPVVVADVGMLADAADGRAIEETLAAAAKLDVPQWLKRQARENLEGVEAGEAPEDAEPNSTYQTLFDIGTGKPRDELCVALLPTRSPWEAAAYHLGWTGVNYDLGPEHHVAVHKYWHEKYGAELVTAAVDTMEMRVARPPRDLDAAMALAREQGGYCPDIITQGVESVEALAAMLVGAGVWYFWWD